jgi:hypothetical protein
MKKPLLIIFILTCFSAKSQTSVYHPFPDSNAIWNVSSQGCCWSDCPPPPTPNPVIDDFNFSYYINGDTVINSTLYHKVYQSGTVHHHCSFGNYVDYWESFSNYYAAIRQDTALRKVYVRDNSPERVLYDFNLSVGDSIENCTAVTSIDSILIGSTYRKRLNIDGAFPYSIIEGIGSTSGLFEPLCPFEYWGTLVCFSQNGVTLYPDTLTECELITESSSAHAYKSIALSPNPFHVSTILYLKKAFKPGVLKIYSTLGSLVKEQIITSENTVITREGLSNGIYFVVVKDGENEWRGKVVVE